MLTGDAVSQKNVTLDTHLRFHNVFIHKHKQKALRYTQSSAPKGHEVRGGTLGWTDAAGKHRARHQDTGTVSRQPPPTHSGALGKLPLGGPPFLHQENDGLSQGSFIFLIIIY